MTKLKNLKIGSKWELSTGTEGVLLECTPSSALVIITKVTTDAEGDTSMPIGKLRISLETEVKEKK